jgi:photosynthetic reaction center cytochrome c subunit
MRIYAAIAVLFFAAAAFADQPVEATRKNIKALQGLPESQLFLAMNFISDSLGVHCDYCHVKSADKWMWASDEKPQKAVGLTMIRMVLAMNKEHFDGNRKLTCYTCHRGSLQIATLAPLPPHDFVKERAAIVPRPVPSPAEIVARYRSAIGTDAEKVRTMVMTAAVDRAAGASNVEIVIEQPDKMLITATTEKGVAKQALAGSSGWVLSDGKLTTLPAEAIAAVRNSAATFVPVKFAEDVSRLRNPRIERAGDRDAYAVDVVDDADTTRTYFFDIQTGLLVRRRTTKQTMIAPLSEQVDFDDYRDVGGVKLPFLIRSSDVASYDTTTRTFTAIRTNVAVDRAIFDAPQTSAGASRQ